jgi:hypothetical protein
VYRLHSPGDVCAFYCRSVYRLPVLIYDSIFHILKLLYVGFGVLTTVSVQIVMCDVTSNSLVDRYQAF